MLEKKYALHTCGSVKSFQVFKSFEEISGQSFVECQKDKRQIQACICILSTSCIKGVSRREDRNRETLSVELKNVICRVGLGENRNMKIRQIQSRDVFATRASQPPP